MKSRQHPSRTAAIAAALGAALLTATLDGCNSANSGAGPWLDRRDLPAEPWKGVSEAEYFNYLVMQTPLVTEDDAYHAFLIWVDGRDDATGFGRRIQVLTQRGMMDANWAHAPTDSLTHGRLAAMICRRYDLRTSVALRLVGPVERAARRELEYRKVMVPGGGDGATMSGAEFVNILKKADELLGPQESVATTQPAGIE
ncbi:MAG: hypothetical protein BIFFINMI_03203 [Phycisphaerae bacterium]|nr:hypothetical protein [Phycisphaerae bacterium]